LQQTVDILTNDKKFLKKSYESLMAKFKKIQEENILIPKKQGASEEDQKSTFQKDANDPGQLLTAHLQEEVRNLHF
jgi:hypothetical protein